MEIRRVVSLALLLIALPGLRAAEKTSDEGVPLLIDIRASVDQRWEGFRKRGAIAHGKLYALVSVKEVEAAEPLVKPLDEAELVRLLRAELGKNGYREITTKEKPEVILTATYGRGYLHNPHIERGSNDESTPGPATLSIYSPKQAMKHRQPGFEEKLQRAQAEKLFITVSAWKYPAAAGEKPQLYWRTVMVTDNADGRDLNLAMPAMLTAGVKYFDEQTKEGEVTVNTTMPTGTVKLGPMNVIEENAKSGK